VRLPLRIAFLLALAAALSAPVGTGQPTPPKVEVKPRDVKPTYTAFPDLTPATRERRTVAKADGQPAVVVVEKGAAPLPPLPKLAADSPPLRRVQYEQLKEGMTYLTQTEEIIRLGAWDIELLRDYAVVASAVYAVAAELEESPTKRVPWFEARVRKLKEFEGYVERGVRAGGAAAQSLNVARFQRLQAEADLLRLKADVEREKKGK
jgi:hypothetical protein